MQINMRTIKIIFTLGFFSIVFIQPSSAQSIHRNSPFIVGTYQGLNSKLDSIYLSIINKDVCTIFNDCAIGRVAYQPNCCYLHFVYYLDADFNFIPKDVRIIDINAVSIKNIDSLKGFNSLEFLSLTVLDTIPELDETQLPSLYYLNLFYYDSLSKVINFIKANNQLVSLSVSCYSGFNEIPEWLSEFNDLEELSISANGYSKIPSPVLKLTKLRKLGFHSEDILFQLDTNIYRLKNLEELNCKINLTFENVSLLSKMNHLNHVAFFNTDFYNTPDSLLQSISFLKEITLWGDYKENMYLKMDVQKRIKKLLPNTKVEFIEQQ